MTEDQLELLPDDAAELQELLNRMRELDPNERDYFINGVQDEQSHWPSTLQSLCAVMEATLAANDIPNNRRTAEELAMVIGNYFGGRGDVYLPNGSRMKTALRDIEIWRHYNGKNLAELAQDYGMTERRVYMIVAEQRRAMVARKQRKLL
ncbi:transcriptional regulator [Shewanella yunxiaonensis]|uniref:Transcriptional regulator n=1 Tax=Shewanella yunxiaonensis TaxID=2829809 RepID=A0ABX7YUJ4_9GAMM|nr:Mor transcription activator family protein [Shewanella yunxiaonensis]QUN06450.1 transcriptional regulator [Shewanella yunxiaonensis]